jgi:hypothetical protein
MLLCEWKVKGKIASGNSFGFQAQIEDFHLKCCILGDEAKNKTTGSYKQPDHQKNHPPKIAPFIRHSIKCSGDPP